MTGKKALILVFLLLLFLTSAKTVKADCVSVLLRNSCPAERSVSCTGTGAANSSTRICCTTASECSTAATGGAPFVGVAQDQPICCDANCTSVNTAIGCIPTNLSGLIFTLMTFGIGLAGGIALLLILVGSFQIMTSAGNPEQLNAGRELVGSAITGLLLIVFSVFILRLIGVDILGIPGFG